MFYREKRFPISSLRGGGEWNMIGLYLNRLILVFTDLMFHREIPISILTLQLVDDEVWLVSTPYVLLNNTLFCPCILTNHLICPNWVQSCSNTSYRSHKTIRSETYTKLKYFFFFWRKKVHFHLTFSPTSFLFQSLFLLCCHSAKTKWAERSGYGRLTLSCKWSVYYCSALCEDNSGTISFTAPHSNSDRYC